MKLHKRKISNIYKLVLQFYRFLKYVGYGNVLSVYTLNKETTTIKLGVKPISFTEIKPTKFSTDKIVYGPYENTKPFAKVNKDYHSL